MAICGLCLASRTWDLGRPGHGDPKLGIRQADLGRLPADVLARILLRELVADSKVSPAPTQRGLAPAAKSRAYEASVREAASAAVPACSSPRAMRRARVLVNSQKNRVLNQDSGNSFAASNNPAAVAAETRDDCPRVARRNLTSAAGR